MRILTLVLTLSMSTVLFAQEGTTSSTAPAANTATETTMAGTSNVTTCTSGSDERKIEIIYETAGSKVPCKVEYTKAGATNTLWTAANEEGYCESKAAALAEKLGGAGFTCQ